MPPESTFNPDVFMSQEIEQPMETRYTPIPEDRYHASIDDDEKSVTIRDAKGTPVLDVTWIVHDDDLKEKMDMERLSVRQSIFLDVEADGRLQFGPNKNIKLGRLREAVGQNGPGAWSFAMLRGQGPCIIDVIITPDKEDPDVKYNRITRTLPLS